MLTAKSAIVLEDNPHMRLLLGEFLRELDILRISNVETVADANEQCRVASFDFALVDIGLEGENGLDFISGIRRDRDHPARRMPMLIVSGQTQYAALAMAREAGADAFLAKPLSQGALQSRLTQVLSSPRPFIESATYFGPDRRRGPDSRYRGPERRRDRPKLLLG